MKTIRVPVDAVRGMLKRFPESVYAAYMAAGEIEDGHLTLSAETHIALLSSSPPHSVAEMLMSAAKAIGNDIRAGLPRRTDEEVAAILKTHCEPCDQFSPKLVRCKQCGCFLRVKVRMAGEHCPLGKW